MKARDETTGFTPEITQSERAELTERQREILRLIVRHYVLTANPVGSRYLARVSSLGLSDASHAKYLGRPRIHGVRRSSAHECGAECQQTKAYRLYVNDLMAREHVTSAERKAVARSACRCCERRTMCSKPPQDILAKLSRAAFGYALLPALDEGILERVEIAAAFLEQAARGACRIERACKNGHAGNR